MHMFFNLIWVNSSELIFNCIILTAVSWNNWDVLQYLPLSISELKYNTFSEDMFSLRTCGAHQGSISMNDVLLSTISIQQCS